MRVALLTVAVVLLLAPAASAGEYRFISSNGTQCTVDTDRSRTPQADGRLTVGVEASLSCTGGLMTYAFGTYVERKSGYEPWWVPGGGQGCNTVWDEDVICDAWPVDVGGAAADLPNDSYEQITYVHLLHATAGVDPRSPTWVVVPMHRARHATVRYAGASPGNLDCHPGYTWLTCEFAEDVR